MGTFRSYGYVPLEPPTVELARSAAGLDERRVLRFLDRDGSLLALRPDITTAVARVVAQRYREARGALRLAYFTSVFRQEHSMRGSEREYDQAGVELIGPSDRVADAEVVALLADALRACGLATAEIDVGHAGVLDGFLDEVTGVARDDARDRARAGDLVSLLEIVRAAGLAPARVGQLRDAFRHRGPLAPFAEGRDQLPPRSASAVGELLELAELLEAAGVSLPVRYDLGLVAPLGYYTGITFQAIAPGLGSAIASGGRYDGLLARFGTDRAATGFGIAVPHLHQALVATGQVAIDDAPLVTLEGGTPSHTLRVAAALRGAGVSVAIGAVAESAGRPVVALRVIDGTRVERDGLVTPVADIAADLASVPDRREDRG